MTDAVRRPREAVTPRKPTETRQADAEKRTSEPVERVVAAAPPLTEQQRERLRTLLSG